MSTPLRRNQFGLSSLLVAVTIVALVCSVAKVYYWHPLIAGAVAGTILLWIVLVTNRHFWVRFAVTLAFIMGANLLSLPPFSLCWFFRLGPFVPMHLVLDIAIALVIATVTAFVLRNGWRGLFHRVRTWGVEHLEPDAPPDEGEEVGVDYSKSGCVWTLALFVLVMMLTVALLTIWDRLNRSDIPVGPY
ncbi:MAG: hypothetical protein HQ567_26770 [Candidatus Nealsonbacteria bacterium]|nr:hypothetical protein [Candidatus Nealsonbacteria bacterium]